MSNRRLCPVRERDANLVSMEEEPPSTWGPIVRAVSPGRDPYTEKEERKCIVIPVSQSVTDMPSDLYSKRLGAQARESPVFQIRVEIRPTLVFGPPDPNVIARLCPLP